MKTSMSEIVDLALTQAIECYMEMEPEAAYDAINYAIHMKTQRQIEKEFKLRPMMEKGRNFKQSEIEWAKRYGFDIFNLREEITTDFNKGKSGQEFMAALKDKGIVLCRGDKSQFVIILPWGQHKALSSMIHGRPTKAVLRRSFADIDITKLPTVAEGKAMVKASLPKAKPRTKGKSGHTLYIGGRSSHKVSGQAVGYQTIPRRRTNMFSVPTPVTASPSLASPTDSANYVSLRPVVISHTKAGDKQKFTPNREDVGGDETPSGRAELAYKEEFDKWAGLIEAAANDQSVPKQQRLANVAALRIQQQAAAKAARKRVSEEEKSTARAARRARRVLLGWSVPPQ